AERNRCAVQYRRRRAAACGDRRRGGGAGRGRHRSRRLILAAGGAEEGCAGRTIGPLLRSRTMNRVKAVSMRRSTNRAVAIAASKQKALRARILVGSALLLSAALLLLLISP